MINQNKMTEQLNHIGEANKMVSSVDFIIKHIDGIRVIDEYEIIKLKEVFEQAKEMHKQEKEQMLKDMQDYAEFCIMCDRKQMPLLLVEDWYKHCKTK